VSLGELTSGSGKLMFKKCFRIFLDEKNYPIDFHCIAGADRTGALTAALYGLLGVPEDVIKVDYTLTSFSTSGIRTAKAFDRMMKKAFGSRPGASFNEKIEAFALECGFTAADLAKFRSIMLK
jgi:protein-tyrosine phosphatase